MPNRKGAALAGNQGDATTDLGLERVQYTPPAELLDHAQWVVWRGKLRPNGKLNKIPYIPGTEARASSTDPASWTDYETARAALDAGADAGLGFVLTKDDPFLFIDLDDCRDSETGEIQPWALKIVDSFKSYTELSPSATGLHIVCNGEWPIRRHRRGKIEAYTEKRFMTVTGKRLDCSPERIGDRAPNVAINLLSQIMQCDIVGADNHAYDEPQRAGPEPSAGDASDEAILDRARTSKNGGKFTALWSGNTAGYDSPSEADLALCSILAFWAGDDPARIDRLFRRSGLCRDKWRERADYRDWTIAKAMGGETYQGRTKRPGSPPETVQKPPTPTTNQQFRQTDTGNAERLAARYGDQIRFNWTRGLWHVWDGKRWAPDAGGELERLAKATARAIPEEAVGLSDDGYAKVLKWAASSESSDKRQAMVRLARSEPGIGMQQSALDANPWLLNVDNGTIDLRVGTLRAHNPHDYLTRLIPTAYEPAASCPTFDRFLARIFTNDAELIRFVWRLIGYSLTGSTREQAIIVCYGTGANGKSTLLGTLGGLLADYAAQADAESFMERRRETIREDIAALDGARFIGAAETSDGRRLSESLVKKMTGGEHLRARRLYENGFDFLPQFKVWLATNHKPEIRGSEHAIWRRVKLLPFAVTIGNDERDPDLTNKLRAEYPGILAKAVRACLDWQSDGLGEPRIVTEATATYRREMDILADWIEERCVTESTTEAPAKALYANYLTWCEAEGIAPIKQRTFGMRLTEHGYGQRKVMSVRYRTGIGLRFGDPDNDPSYQGHKGRIETQECNNSSEPLSMGTFSNNASRYVPNVPSGENALHCSSCDATLLDTKDRRRGLCDDCWHEAGRSETVR